MNHSFLRSLYASVFILIAASASQLPAATPAEAKARSLPEILKAWQGWATWDDTARECPSPYRDGTKHICLWPSRLGLQVDRAGARFDLGVTVFSETWVPLPGGKDSWPLELKANGTVQPVVEHDGVPAVRLAAGTYRLEGFYRWNDMPQRIPLPREIGILALTLDGKPVEAPIWDAQGFLWLKRDGSTEEADKDFLALKQYSVLEDGIPLWLQTEIELTVSGKSREEDLGTVLPTGWKLTTVESPIPVVVDEAGRMKAQVRAGKWTVHLDAFRSDNPKEVSYAVGANAAAKDQLIAFRSRPDFRVVEITGISSIDVSQTPFPDKWRDLPVYRWDTASPFKIEERLRGMGQQKAAGLTIARVFWLDENGRGLTFRDVITGKMQQIWRLDAAEGQDLGSVRSGGQGQLITRNPKNNAPGVEIRTRVINLEATGRMNRAADFPATGWRADADALRVTLNLPPGWRLFALFGADWVRGDWLTAWTLLDLFLLLIFTLAVFRLWGIGAATLAFFAFGLAYHEPDAPRFVWLFLLVPLALLRVVPEGRGRKLVVVTKWILVVSLLLIVIPFLTQQVQQALYPQLEQLRSTSVFDGFLMARKRSQGTTIKNDLRLMEDKDNAALYAETSSEVVAGSPMPVPDQPVDGLNAPTTPPAVRRGDFSQGIVAKAAPQKQAAQRDNLLYDAKARIQTGPGVPDWTWRSVSFGWNGPVQASQQVHPILISLGLERFLTILRIVFILALVGVLLNVRQISGRIFRRTTKAAALLAVVAGFACATTAQAQIPDAALIQTLRQRLLVTSDAFPNAADIPTVTLTINDRKITIEADIHAATRTAVPLPGRLPAWSPVSVLVDGKPEVSLRRDDGYLWVVLAEGVHRVRVEGLLPDVTEWEWTFLLKPHLVKIDAPAWNFTGVRADGAPEQQVFFARKQKAAAGAATYDRSDLQSIVAIHRQIELGLVWQVHTKVSRLSPVGKAITLHIPLLPGENVISANAVVKDGFIDLRLGAQEESAGWESSLEVTPQLKLATRAGDPWVERWDLEASPVWNVTLSGLAPIFESRNPALVPVWQPWPGESVELAISRPDAIAGATVTVNRATHEIALGDRQRVSKLSLALRCSLGEDFLIDLPADAEITSLTLAGKEIPVRKDGSRVIIPVRPGDQAVVLAWKRNVDLNARVRSDAIKLPVESANATTIITIPPSRLTLWAGGPQVGPAVRFWGILLCSLIGAVILGRLPRSPLRTFEWMLLFVGLTQVPLVPGLIVIGWLFFMTWRGQESFQRLKPNEHNALQVLLAFATALALGTILLAVREGLLGIPEMFITGNGSRQTVLRWYQARCDTILPQPWLLSISIWWYRFFMLAWALWLGAALIRWLRGGWDNFSSGGIFRKPPPTPKPDPTTPPPLPAKS